MMHISKPDDLEIRKDVVLRQASQFIDRSLIKLSNFVVLYGSQDINFRSDCVQLMRQLIRTQSELNHIISLRSV